MIPKKPFPCAHGRQRQRGAAMIEMLLALVIAGALLTYYLIQSKTNTSDLRANTIAQNIDDFSIIAEQYLKSNKDPLTAAMKDGTGAASWCVINANPATGAGTVANNVAKHTCAVDISFLKYKKVVPQSYSEVNALNQRWTAIYRLIYDDFDNNPATPVTDGGIEMLVVAATNGGKEKTGSIDETTTAANIAGSNAGYIPNGRWGDCHYDASAKSACGQGGAWHVDLNSFMDAP